MSHKLTHVRSSGIEAAYRQMAKDIVRENEALEWSEGLIADIPAEDVGR